MLGQFGLRTCVVERYTTRYRLPRAVHYDHETARILQNLGVGVQACSVAHADIAVEFHNAERKVLMTQGVGGMGISGWPSSNMFYQPELEDLLDRRVQDFPSVERRLGYEVTQVEDGEPVRVRIRNLESQESSELTAKYVVGCDGAKSFVRPLVDTEQADLNFSHRWLVVSGTMRGRKLGATAIQLCDPYRPQTFVPVGPHRIRFEFMLRPDETGERMNTPEAAWVLMKPWGYTPEDVNLERHAVYTYSAKWSQRWRHGNLMVAGDAAHQTPPFLGQGLCSGTRDVLSLAWRISMVLAGKANEKILDDYTSERVPHLAEIVTKAVEIGNVLCVTDPQQAAARDAAMLAEKRSANIVYTWRLGPGTFRENDPAARLQSLQREVRRDSKVALLDDMVPAGFRLITSLPAEQLKLSDANRRFLADVQCQVVSIADEYEDVTGMFKQWLDDFGAKAIIVRPDFYNFGMAGTAAEVNELVADLHHALRGRNNRPMLARLH
jgi:2-polyprenyl-6-methoxyphenol hydroxylase-like FAD-dependent oxidoreductase